MTSLVVHNVPWVHILSRSRQSEAIEVRVCPRATLAERMDRERVKALYRACDHLEALSVEDPRNVDLDEIGGGDPRGDHWVKKMAVDYELSATPVCKLLSGLPGSGKSTELRRLLHQLDTMGFVTVLIDAEKEIDLASPIDAPEIVAVVVQEVERAVLLAEGKDPDEAFKTGYLRRLADYLNNTDIEFGTTTGGKGPLKLTAALKTNPTLREQFRKILAPRLTQFLEEARQYVEGLQKRAKQLDREGIVVALDSLEKLRGPADDWERVMDSAERVFGHGAEHVQLPLHTIYTVPTALLSRQLDIEFMPAVKIRERDGGEYKPGVNALHELIRRRLNDEDREELFGDTRAQTRMLNRIIGDSGGYLRSIVRALREVVAAESHPVTDEFIEKIFQRRVDEYKRLVTREDHDFLVDIAAEQELIPLDRSSKSRRLAEHLLTTSAVLRYQRTNEWFDLHPAVRHLPGLREKLQAVGPRWHGVARLRVD